MPMVGSRRQQMVARGTLFGAPCYRWVPHCSSLKVRYCAFITASEYIPESIYWDGEDGIEVGLPGEG